MQVKVEDLSSVKKTLHIEIPQDQVVSELDSAYKQLKKSAKIKGFRPGKAPRSVLERLYGKDVRADVSSRLIQTSFVDALKETDLQVIGNPKLDPPELDVNGPYQYDATVEIKPDINDIDFKGLTLKKTKFQVSDEEIDLQLKALQKNLAQLKPVTEERPAGNDDFVLIDYEGLKDGKPFAEAQSTRDFNLQIGKGQIHEDFDAGLVGMKPGETKEIRVKFAEDYSNEKLAGLDIDFQVTLNEIREQQLPEIDDELAKKAGNYTSLDELKTQINNHLEQGYTKRAEQELNEQIFKALISKVDFEVPESMVDYEMEGIIAETERSLQYQNRTLEDMGLTREGISEKYNDTAVRQVRRHLILDKIINQEALELTDDELDDGFKDMAASFNQPADEIKQYYRQNNDKLEFFKHTLLEKKAIALIIGSSEIEEVEPEKSADT